MKLFWKNLGLFFGLPLIIALAGSLALGYFNQQTMAYYTLPAGVTTIVMGDSHAELAIDDRHWPQAINLANTSESFLFTYYKLQPLLAHNPQIRRVYLSYGYHSLSGYYDEVLSGKPAKDVATRYFYILPAPVRQHLLLSNRNALLLTLRNIGLNGIKNLVAHKKPMLGQYENDFLASTMVPEAMIRRVKSQFYQDGKLIPFSENNISYLQRIVRLCKERHVDLVMLSTPVHPAYEARVPETYKQKYREVAQGLTLREFHNLLLPDNSFAPDGDHVSALGAQLVTAALQKTDSTAR